MIIVNGGVSLEALSILSLLLIWTNALQILFESNSNVFWKSKAYFVHSTAQKGKENVKKDWKNNTEESFHIFMTFPLERFRI